MMIEGSILTWVVEDDDYDNEDFYYDEPGGIDDDCGFDPYMGCFTDDC